MKENTKDYMEYLASKKEVTTADLQPIDFNTPTWFDALLNHKNFNKIMEVYISDNNSIHHCLDTIRKVKIQDIQKLYNPTLGNILKLHVSWDNAVYNPHTNRYNKYMNNKTDLYFTENGRLIANKKGARIVLTLEYYLIKSGKIFASDFDNILMYVNNGVMINGQTYKEFNDNYYKKLAKFEYFDKVSELEKKFEEDKKKLEQQLQTSTAVVNEELSKRRKKFILQVKYNSLIDKKPIK